MASIFFSCQVLPNSLRGTYWEGEVLVTRSGYNATSETAETVKIWLYEFGSAEVRGLSAFNSPYINGKWSATGDKIIITGEYAAGNAVYTHQKSQFKMVFKRDGQSLTLIPEGSYAKKYEKSETYAIEIVPLESNYTFKPSTKPLQQGLFFKDIEETLWYSEITIEAPQFDDDYSYTKDRKEGKLLLEVYFFKKYGADDTKIKVKVTTASSNWTDVEDPSKEYPLGTVIYYPWVREGDWEPRFSEGPAALWMTVKVAGEITLLGDINSIDNFENQTEWVVKKENATFSIETIVPANPSGTIRKFVLKDDIVLKKDLKYHTSSKKFK